MQNLVFAVASFKIGGYQMADVLRQFHSCGFTYQADAGSGFWGQLDRYGLSQLIHDFLNRKTTSRTRMASAGQGINLRMTTVLEGHAGTRLYGFTAAGGKGGAAHAAAFSGWRLAMTDHCTSGRRSSQRTPVRASMRGQYSAGICRSPSRQKMTDCGGTLMPFARRCALPAASIAISIGFMPAILHL